MCERLSNDSALLPGGHQLAAATIVLHESIGANFKLALSSATRGWKHSIITIMCPARAAEALHLDLLFLVPSFLEPHCARLLRNPLERDHEGCWV
jgi:hypothetical protein